MGIWDREKGFKIRGVGGFPSGSQSGDSVGEVLWDQGNLGLLMGSHSGDGVWDEEGFGIQDLGSHCGDGVWDQRLQDGGLTMVMVLGIWGLAVVMVFGMRGILGRYRGSHSGDGVERGVGADAEVRARDVVGDGGGHDAQGDAELLEACPALHQLQATCERLRDNGDTRGQCRDERNNGGTDQTWPSTRPVNARGTLTLPWPCPDHAPLTAS